VGVVVWRDWWCLAVRCGGSLRGAGGAGLWLRKQLLQFSDYQFLLEDNDGPLWDGVCAHPFRGHIVRRPGVIAELLKDVIVRTRSDWNSAMSGLAKLLSACIASAGIKSRRSHL